ncbi:hypothetical protein C8Q74DRAFT_1390362 [Fomes fomentarius]|nr:hypothetical protein C8Q74DRAFT_1390362 [Fomes fomentarius]
MSSILFLVNRYLSLAYNLIVVLSPGVPADYKVVWLYIFILELMQYLPWAGKHCSLAFALSSRSWLLAMLVLLLSIVPIVSNIVRHSEPFSSDLGSSTNRCMQVKAGTTTPVYDSEGCYYMYKLSTTTKNQWVVLMLSRVGLIASDLLVMAITWATTYASSKEMRELGQKISLSRILLRDGARHSTLMVMNTLHLSFSLLSVSTTQLDPTSSSITAILVSRFLIDLQEANKKMISTLEPLQLGAYILPTSTSTPGC